MAGRVEWIATGSDLGALAGRIGPGAVALDCEADSLHHYPEKTCLVQLSHGGTDHLIDPLALDDLAPLAPVLGDSQHRKILHGADYDLRVLERDFGLRIHGLFDTMVAARLAGEPGLGLAALLETHVGVRLDKRYQRADWSQRPLSAEMESYAALDTRHLEELAFILESRLRQLGRDAWAREEFVRLEAVRWRESDPADAFRRIKGSGRLSPRSQLILRELWQLRESEARARDRPPFKVLPDSALLAVARAAPDGEPELQPLDSVPQSWRSGGRAQRILEAVARGRNASLDSLPAAAPRPVRRRTPDKGLEKLLAARDALAASLGLEPSVLGPRRVLEQLHARRESGDDPSEIPELRLWQAELLVPLLGD